MALFCNAVDLASDGALELDQLGQLGRLAGGMVSARVLGAADAFEAIDSDFGLLGSPLARPEHDDVTLWHWTVRSFPDESVHSCPAPCRDDCPVVGHLAFQKPVARHAQAADGQVVPGLFRPARLELRCSGVFMVTRRPRHAFVPGRESRLKLRGHHPRVIPAALNSSAVLAFVEGLGFLDPQGNSLSVDCRHAAPQYLCYLLGWHVRVKDVKLTC